MASTLEVDQIKHSSGVAFTLPQVDGTAGQVLKTNASRVLSFTDADPDSGKGSDVASAAPCVIPDGDLYYDVTGTTNFVAFTVSAGRHFFVQFNGILTMTHHATNLDLPGADDIVTAAGDVAEFFAHTANQVQCVNYTRASGLPVIKVAYAGIQNVSADERILGRVSGADGVVEELTKAQVLTFANVEDGADVTDATNVTAAGALMDSECSGLAAVKATTGTFLTADQTKLDAIEASADVTDATNVTAAGALMDSECAGLAAVKATTGTFLTADQTKLDAIEASATADQTAGEIKTLLKEGVPLDATPDSDHTANGPQTSTLNAGYSSAIGDLVYLHTDGEWHEADADDEAKSISLLGIALEVKTDGQAMNVALSGSFVRDDTYNFNVGVPLYIHTSIGEITHTKPSGTGDIVRTVGYAITADIIYFNPSSDYVTLA